MVREHDLTVGPDIDEQDVFFCIFQPAYTGAGHNVRADVGGYRRQAVEPRPFCRFQPDLGGRDIPCLYEHGGIGRSSDRSRVYS